MPWLIQRTGAQTQTSFWGRAERWIVRTPAVKTTELGKYRVPEGAARYMSYDAAFDVAQWLRTHQTMCFGEVIAVVSEPERT
jgi:hypothetical protein